MAKLVACLDQARTEFNTLSPGRDKASDGWIGDRAHAGRASDHNPDESGRPEVGDADNVDEVHAIDVDADLRRPGVTMALVVAMLVGRCRAGREKRLRYIIFNRTIWSASRRWEAANYTGSSPHVKHGHLSASYVSALEADRRPWGIADVRPPRVPGEATKPSARPAPLKLDGKLGPETIKAWQRIMKTPVDGKITDRSTLVSAVQRHLNRQINAGLKVDGDGDSIRQGGPRTNTQAALQRYLGTARDGVISVPTSAVVVALQRRLNTGRF